MIAYWGLIYDKIVPISIKEGTWLELIYNELLKYLKAYGTLLSLKNNIPIKWLINYDSLWLLIAKHISIAYLIFPCLWNIFALINKTYKQRWFRWRMELANDKAFY